MGYGYQSSPKGYSVLVEPGQVVLPSLVTLGVLLSLLN